MSFCRRRAAKTRWRQKFWTTCNKRLPFPDRVDKSVLFFQLNLNKKESISSGFVFYYVFGLYGTTERIQNSDIRNIVKANTLKVPHASHTYLLFTSVANVLFYAKRFYCFKIVLKVPFRGDDSSKLDSNPIPPQPLPAQDICIYMLYEARGPLLTLQALSPYSSRDNATVSCGRCVQGVCRGVWQQGRALIGPPPPC